VTADVSTWRGTDGGYGKAVVATTHWKLLGSSKQTPVSLVSLDLETGAKHQLRIHLSKVLNAPVVGDPLYYPPHLAPVGVQPGLYLHASQIALHAYRQLGPHKRFEVGITAPLPPYFIQACKKFKIPLTDELVDGGVRVDGVQQDLSFLRKGEGTENGMRWLLQPSTLRRSWVPKSTNTSR